MALVTFLFKLHTELEKLQEDGLDEEDQRNIVFRILSQTISTKH